MIKEINYKGVTESPSDYESLDGELSVSINAIHDSQGVKPILPYKRAMRYERNLDYKEIVFVHTTSKFKHCLFVSDGTVLMWSEFKENYNDDDVHLIADVSYSIERVSSIGNVVIINTTQGIHYALWKDGSYVYLGEHMPELNLKFGLVGGIEGREDAGVISTESALLENGSSGFGEGNSNLNEELQKLVTDNVMASVNKFINEESTEKDRFMFPFLVRYAYRLYDGSLTMHSAPILMTPTLTDAPMAAITYIGVNAKGGARDYHYSVRAMVCDLHIKAEVQNKKDLQAWGDIIKSIDIFVSKPLYTHDQSGKIKGLTPIKDDVLNFIGLNRNSREAFNGEFGGRRSPELPAEGETRASGVFLDKKGHTPEELVMLQKYDGFLCEKTPGLHGFYVNGKKTQWSDKIWTKTYNLPDNDKWTNFGQAYKFILPENEFEEQVVRSSQFFLIKSIPIDEIPTSYTKEDIEAFGNKDIPNPFKKVELRKGTLKSLVNREAMTDDYDSHDVVFGKCSYTYNARFNMASITKMPFHGFPLSACTQHTSPKGSSANERARASVTYLANKYGRKVTYHFESEDFAPNMPFLYIYHPDPDVQAAFITIQYPSGTSLYKAEMKRHEFLNGSFFFSMKAPTNYDILPIGDTEPQPINYPNKIYTSEVNNPFFFPVRNINTVGTGEILGLSSSTKAISSGQFGQFPMYAFSTDGIWALEVSSTGGFSARQPITRDVCNNPLSITQLDNSVLFTSDRGVMIISGGESVCISEVLDSPTPFLLSSLPSAMRLPIVDDLGELVFENVPLKEYLKSANFVFDYVEQRIIMFSPKKAFAYVFSIESKSWGMMPCDWKRAINCYPTTLAQKGDGDIYDLTKSDFEYTNQQHNILSLLVTRPLKLGDADVLKTIDTIIQRGKFSTNDLTSVLYGSRDLYTWIPIWSSNNSYMRGFRGTPYKYFRIVIGGKLENEDHISGCTIQYTPRQVNQPR